MLEALLMVQSGRSRDRGRPERTAITGGCHHQELSRVPFGKRALPAYPCRSGPEKKVTGGCHHQIRCCDSCSPSGPILQGWGPSALHPPGVALWCHLLAEREWPHAAPRAGFASGLRRVSSACGAVNDEVHRHPESNCSGAIAFSLQKFVPHDVQCKFVGEPNWRK